MLIDLNTSQLDRIKVNTKLQNISVTFLINNTEILKHKNLFIYYIRSNIYILSINHIDPIFQILLIIFRKFKIYFSIGL